MKDRVMRIFDTLRLRGYDNEIRQQDINSIIWEVCGCGDRRTFEKYTNILIQIGKLEKGKANQYGHLYKIKDNGIRAKIEEFKKEDQNA
jgi:hypothetical protein